MNTSNLKVSVITTCYNRANTIARTVNCIKEQDFDGTIEHIIIDGGSTDGSVQVIQACNSHRIAFMSSERDRGCYNALNKGLAHATGDIVCWLHSDDVYTSNHVISDVVKVFAETDCDMLYANGLYVSAENPKWVIRDWISGKYSDKKIENGWLPLHTTVFVKREVARRAGAYDESYHIASDSLWLVRLMYKTGIRINYLNQYVVRMNYGGLSATFGKTFLRWKEDLRLYSSCGIPAKKALLQKVLRKVPQFLRGPFK